MYICGADCETRKEIAKNDNLAGAYLLTIHLI